MIKWKQSKKVPTTAKRYNGWVTKIMVGRVCDKCGKEEEVYWGTVKKSRERRGINIDSFDGTDYCYKCSQIGRKMPCGPEYKLWKHGKTYNGYSRVTRNGRRVLEHVAVMEEYLNRKMMSGEIIHHIDMDKSNNKINNLYVFKCKKDHVTCHNAMERCGYELLNERVWFDWSQKKYTLIPQARKTYEEAISLRATGKLYRDKWGYLIYREKDFTGTWRQKKYHILVVETLLGRRLLRDECVHHIDGDKLNNYPDNLCVMTRTEHTSCHAALQKIVASVYKTENIIKFEDGVYHLTV